MTTPEKPTNGNGYTQKEMLARIEGKLDAISGQVERLTIDFAVHEAAPYHPSAVADINAMRERGRANQLRMARLFGGIAAAVFLVDVAMRLFA